MILTDREIRSALTNAQIEIVPAPAQEAFNSLGIDLTLDAPGRIWRRLPRQPIHPGAADYNYENLVARQDRIASLDGYALAPAAFLLAWTRETITLPITSRLAARVESKSSLACLGLGVHLAAPAVHAGFKGQLQLGLVNLGPHEIILNVGMPICQLVFEIAFGTPTKAVSANLPPR